MRKRKYIIILILVVLLLIPMIDGVCYNSGRRPIFAKDIGGGGEVIIYTGFCYSINYYYPETTKADETEIASEWMWFWEH